MFMQFSGSSYKVAAIFAAVVLILAAAGLGAWKSGKLAPLFSAPVSAPNNVGLDLADSSASDEKPAINVLPPGGGQIPPYNGRSVHAIEADPGVLKQIPPGTYDKSRAELADLAVKLADNPLRADDWMRVAFIKRFYHDYLGARDAYEYLNLIDEREPIPFYNLGSLYGYYLNEPAKAVPKFEQAIKLDPANVSFYTGFADFYRDVMNDFPSAERVLLQGLSKVPADANIMIALGLHYKTSGDVPKAVEYYEKALNLSVLSSGDRLRIAEELGRLRKIVNP